MVIVPFISASNSSERHYYQRLLEFLCTLANFSGHRRQNLNSLSGDESVKEEGGSVQALLLIRPISQMSDRPIIIGTRPHTKVTTELKKTGVLLRVSLPFSQHRDVIEKQKTGKCGNFDKTGGGGLPKSHFFCNLFFLHAKFILRC